MNTLSMARCGWLLALVVTIASALPASSQTININGTLGSGSTSYPYTTGTHAGRLNRFAPPSTCAAPEACPGYFSLVDSRAYDAYRFTNCSGASVCLQFDLTTPCAGTNFLMVVAYLDAFDPSNLCTNYLGDMGASPNPSGSFSVTVPAGATAVLVVSAVTPGAAVGCTYTLSVTGFAPASDVATDPSVATVLLPSDGTMRTIPFSFACSITQGQLQSVTSSDADAGTFAGDQPGDIQGGTPGSSSVDLRAEYTPGTAGRVYTATFTNDELHVVVPSQTGTYAMGGVNACGAALAPQLPSIVAAPATIPFTLTSAANVSIIVYSLRGKELARLATNQAFTAGSHSVTWNGTTTLGRGPGASVPDGHYIVVLKACGYTDARPIEVDRP